ncbi:MAG: hypothetical protein Q8O72_08870 [Bacteroidales bacterium]|nr:hypothetical protein [Bacteroidales bacterium]
MKLFQVIFQSPYKRPIIIGLIVLALVLVLLIADLIFSVTSVNRMVNLIQSDTTENRLEVKNWDSPTQNTLLKDKYWIENQIAVSRDDSMSLGINMDDSTIQLQFKGLALIKSRIAHSYPEKFLSVLDAENYSIFFGNPLIIKQSMANIAKRPFRKVKVNADGITQAVDSVTHNKSPFSWSFVTNNNIRIVINGFGSDSLDTEPSYRQDVFYFRLAEKTRHLFGPYTPTLFIWMNDKEAEAIYRALPKNARVIVRN